MIRHLVVSCDCTMERNTCNCGRVILVEKPKYHQVREQEDNKREDQEQIEQSDHDETGPDAMETGEDTK
jgi:hypothetical protein